MKDPILIRAAELLEQFASDIRDCNTFDDKLIEGTRGERQEHDELISVATRLRRLADRNTDDCPHADPHRYCMTCVVEPCPIGLGGK